MNGISSLVLLFDSRAIQSFISLVLSKRFTGAPREQDRTLDVEIVADRSRS